MEFHGIITNIIGYPNRPTFIIDVREERRERSVRILDIHGARPIGNDNVDLLLNGNLLTDNDPEEIECIVIVEVHDILWNNGGIYYPEDYMNKQVYVSSLH